MRRGFPVLRSSSFDLQSFTHKLTTEAFGKSVRAYESVKSTQKTLLAIFPRPNEGHTLIADVQSAGRGRHGHEWVSPPGGLTFSFQCQLRNTERLAMLQHLVSLAVARAANDVASVRIKWPNDIYSDPNYTGDLGMKKLAGILLQSSSSGNGVHHVAVGVGLNVENDTPTTSLRALSRGDPRLVTRESVLAQFFNHFEPMYRNFLAAGFAPHLDEYKRLWLHSGQQLQLAEPQGKVLTVVDMSPTTGNLLEQIVLAESWPESAFEDPSRPLHVDVGVAKGRFIMEMAALNGDVNFLGLEIRQPLVDQARSWRDERGMKNLEYLFCNANVSLDCVLSRFPAGVLETVSIQFPDPWFKKKHHKRRVMQPELIEVIAKHLGPHGQLYVVSDVLEVAEHMHEAIDESSLFVDTGPGQWLASNPFAVTTEREKACITHDRPVYPKLFRKR